MSSGDYRIPFIPVETGEHKLFRQGNSWVVTVPHSFVKAAEAIGDRRLRSTLFGGHLLYDYGVMGGDDIGYDLLSVAFDCLFALYHINEDKEVRKILERVFERLIVVQEILNDDDEFQ